MKLRNLLSQLTLLIVLNLIVACQSTLISTEEAQAPVDLTAEHGGETPSPMLATQEPEPTATQSVAENLDDVEPEVPEEDSQEVISETVSTELNPIVIKLPPENVQEVILSPTRINLPEDAVTQYEGTEQYVSALAFDETNALWAQIGGQTVRWNIDDGSYAIVESPTGLLKIEDIDCYSLAEELSLPTFPADCVLGPDNTYWFSTYGEGIYNHVDGEWMHITADDGLPENEIRGLAFDQDGNLWVATSAGVGRLDGDSWILYSAADGLPESGVKGMAVDGYGNIWVGSDDSGALRFDGQSWTAYPLTEDGANVYHFVLDNNGDPWISVADKLFHYVDSEDAWETMSMNPFEDESFFSPSVFDVEVMPAGEVWVAMEYGVLLLEDDSVAYFGEEDGLPDIYVRDIVRGSDDTLWFGTSDGLAHFDDEQWVTYRLNEGIDLTYALTVSRLADGTLWFGGDPGAVQLDGGSWHNYSDFLGDLPLLAFAIGPDGEIYGAGCAGIYRLDGETWLPVIDMYDQEPDAQILNWCITSMDVAPDGSFWVNQVDIGQVNGHGVIHIIDDTNTWYGEFQNLFPDRNIVEYPCGREYVLDILVLDDGQVWIGTEDGLCVFDSESWQKLPDELLTSELTYVPAIQQAVDGELWLGTYDGFAHYDGSVWTNYKLDGVDESSLGFWRDIDIDRDGNVWVLLAVGIGRFDGKEFVLYSSNQEGEAEPSFEIPWTEYATGFAIDQDGSVWIAAGPAGIVKLEIPKE